MKPLPFKIPKTSDATLIVQEDRGAILYDHYHQHEELQISLIVQGEGKLVVRDSFSEYRPGDLLVFGSKVPHLFKSTFTGKETYMISLFFTEDSFGRAFFDLPEFSKLKSFFENTSYGFKVLSQPKGLHQLFLTLVHSKQKLHRFILFLQVLECIIDIPVQKLSQQPLQKKYREGEGQRMAKVFQRMIEDFNEDISLSEIARMANMTPNAFCRYFKQRTNKTFFQFLTEIRITNVTRLLEKNRELSIAEAAYQSGFKNLSNFNRKFKAIKQITPSAYKKTLNDPHLF
ncbi:AraC family transcriptional regulator [Aquimarina brevivitae]|uniref:AraC family transcriptional regulator n=1 Tax=Aquimarina brevivitae TaxID=323412 RepID=A0A4Q7PGR1_9FLAO|nr:helix-turn-helix domain-containing protein [Aquimarina brevivitae]RZS99723.1 AraC family transcriptional regulator [Aquimarina brevivitae]